MMTLYYLLHYVYFMFTSFFLYHLVFVFDGS